MRRTLQRLALFLLATALPALAQAADTVGDCRIGAYRLVDGSMVDIGASDGEALRWRRFDGTVGALRRLADGRWSSTLGWTDRGDGKTVSFSDCPSGDIRFDNMSGHRIAFDVTDTIFEGAGVKLAGRLVLPAGGDRVPIVVLVPRLGRLFGSRFLRPAAAPAGAGCRRVRLRQARHRRLGRQVQPGLQPAGRRRRGGDARGPAAGRRASRPGGLSGAARAAGSRRWRPAARRSIS